MEVIIVPGCYQEQLLNELKGDIHQGFEQIFNKFGLDTVEKIVITEDDYDQYKQAIIQYSDGLAENVHVTNDPFGEGAGITVCGTIDGTLKQFIFVKNHIFLAFLLESDVSADDLSDKRGTASVMHEVGHAVDHQIIFSRYNYAPAHKAYILPAEYEAYIKAESLTLWSEYYAERFASCYYQSPIQSYEQDLLDFIAAADRDPHLFIQLNHSYRTLYLLAHYVAYFHHYDQPIPLFESAPYGDLRDKYLKLFIPISNYWRSTHRLVGHWDFNYVVQMLAVGFKGIVDLDNYLYEKAIQNP